MSFFWWKNIGGWTTESDTPCPHRDRCCHEIRNATTSMRLERRQLIAAISQYLVRTDRLVARIEKSLNGGEP